MINSCLVVILKPCNCMFLYVPRWLSSTPEPVIPLVDWHKLTYLVLTCRKTPINQLMFDRYSSDNLYISLITGRIDIVHICFVVSASIKRFFRSDCCRSSRLAPSAAVISGCDVAVFYWVHPGNSELVGERRSYSGIDLSASAFRRGLWYTS